MLGRARISQIRGSKTCLDFKWEAATCCSSQRELSFLVAFICGQLPGSFRNVVVYAVGRIWSLHVSYEARAYSHRASIKERVFLTPKWDDQLRFIRCADENWPTDICDELKPAYEHPFRTPIKSSWKPEGKIEWKELLRAVTMCFEVIALQIPRRGKIDDSMCWYNTYWDISLKRLHDSKTLNRFS